MIRVRKGSGRTLKERFGWVLMLFKRDAHKENKGGERKKAPQDKGEKILP